jgi:hypothetical protein
VLLLYKERWIPACHVHTAPECSYKYEKIYTFHIYHVYGACTVCTCELALRHFFSQGRPKEKWRPQKRTSVFVRLMWGVASLWRLTQIIVSEKLLYPRTYIVALPPQNFHILQLHRQSQMLIFWGSFNDDLLSAWSVPLVVRKESYSLVLRNTTRICFLNSK